MGDGEIKEGKEMIVALQFLGMRKVIEVQSETMEYKVALPTLQSGYVYLVFTPKINDLYGRKGEPKTVFVFDHVEEKEK